MRRFGSEVAGRVRQMVVGVSSLADCKLLGWRGRAGQKERQDIPKNRCRTIIAEPIGENDSETALFRASGRLLKPPTRLLPPPVAAMQPPMAIWKTKSSDFGFGGDGRAEAPI